MIKSDNISTVPLETNRILSTQTTGKVEDALERALRPKSMQDYVGQTKIKEQLEIFIQASKKRQESLDHVLLFGPPGLGKTTMAHIIARELGSSLKQTSGPVLRNQEI